MKLKRRLMTLVLSATMLFSAVIVAQAADYVTLNAQSSSNGNARLHGLLIFSSGSWFTEDDYTYRVTLTGTNRSYYVPRKTDNVVAMIYDDEEDVLKTLKPYNAEWNLEGEFSAGRWSDYGKITLKCFEATNEAQTSYE